MIGGETYLWEKIITNETQNIFQKTKRLSRPASHLRLTVAANNLKVEKTFRLLAIPWRAVEHGCSQLQARE